MFMQVKKYKSFFKTYNAVELFNALNHEKPMGS